MCRTRLSVLHTITYCVVVLALSVSPINIQAQVIVGGSTANLNSSTTFNRKPMPVFMGVREDTTKALFADPLARSSTTAGAFRWQARGGFQAASGHWVITPLNNSLARIDWILNNQLYALQAINIQQPLQCVAPNSSLGQLWRLQRFPGEPSNFLLESLLFPGHCATFVHGSILLQPIGFFPTQQWWFERPPALTLPPVFRNTSQQYIPNPPLPPAQVTLVNGSQDRVIALVAEISNPTAAREIEIAGRGTATVELQRDPGATIIETNELSSPRGIWDRQERTYQVPPVPLYDISIYEIFLQSIAIDRTGTSPNPIEDVNYQPRSIGIFQVPPGSQLPQNARIDVMQTAQRSRNAGGVRPLHSKMKLPRGAESASDPLKDILNEIQSRRRDF